MPKVTALGTQGKIESWWNEVKKNNEGSPVLQRMKEAFAFFQENGFPHKKLEDWKYTNVRKITKFEYEWPLKEESILDKSSFEELPLVKGLDAYKLVFVNGYLRDDLSVLPEGENAFTVTHLEDVEADGAYEEHLASVVTNESGFTALNTAMHSGGFLIDVPKGVEVDKPIFVYYVAVKEEEAYLIQPRNLIIVEDNSRVNIAEIFLSKGENRSLTNVVTEIKAGNGSFVDYSKIQLERGESYQIGYTKIQQEKDSKVDTHQINLDGAFVRNDLHFYLNGTGCESILNGLYILDGHQFLDNHTRSDHIFPKCHTNELYKGILSDHSTGVFNGKVVVQKEAQQTDAYQNNPNILLSNDASINTKPELEIYADDVICTHGATTGYLDQEAIFYLRSRGLSKKEAQHLLLKSFAYEIIERFNLKELIDPLKELVDEKLRRIED